MSTKKGSKSRKEAKKVEEEVESEVPVTQEEEPEESPIEIPEEEETKKKKKKETKGKKEKKQKKTKTKVPSLPTVDDVLNDVDAWSEFYDELGAILEEAEGGSEEEDEDESESENEEAGSEEDEEKEKEKYVSETLKERKKRATKFFEWMCYEFPSTEEPGKDDVLCCVGDECAYEQNPELIKRGKKGKKGKKGELPETGYGESRKLLGTEIYMCDRCFKDARKEIDAAKEKETEGEEEVGKKKKGKKNKEEEEVPLIIPETVESAIAKEYKEAGLPREPKKTEKKKGKAESESEAESESGEESEAMSE